ncbi:LysR family transcriptional regulator [Noviherbaspirillum pedocola]|uniref:LysR family transcriptional regulator n=1 Tax=Noviherbaspirillum pedocola TaxID=2801341 RepID=A0A934SU87_9BURK|nr:LysR family transcriptional regulator [Noviherbaspirillum pedocola]MBK4736680.1 LysR family transcriptional regulator [Noviherbaspirillum pedocola]
MTSQNSRLLNNDPLLRDLALFCEIARRASFIAAASELGISAAHASGRIAALEAMLGVKLFHRTTRRVSVSEDGETVYRWALKILEDVEGMTDAVASVRSEPRGLLRISSSRRLGHAHLAPILSLLRQRHPGLETWLELLDRRVDLIGEGFDIDLRVGAVEEPHLIAHKIVSSRRILCASPAYVARRGMPAVPADLARHDCLVFRDRETMFGAWRLQGDGGVETVKVSGPMASNHSDIVLQWALDGHGIIMASVWDVAESLDAGALRRILPGWHDPADVWAVTPARSTESARLRVCLAFLKEQLTQGPFALRADAG